MANEALKACPAEIATSAKGAEEVSPERKPGVLLAFDP